MDSPCRKSPQGSSQDSSLAGPFPTSSRRKFTPSVSVRDLEQMNFNGLKIAFENMVFRPLQNLIREINLLSFTVFYQSASNEQDLCQHKKIKLQIWKESSKAEMVSFMLFHVIRIWPVFSYLVMPQTHRKIWKLCNSFSLFHWKMSDDIF